jgi:hypothetical protein
MFFDEQAHALGAGRTDVGVIGCKARTAVERIILVIFA